MGYEGWVLQQIPFNTISLPHMTSVHVGPTCQWVNLFFSFFFLPHHSPFPLPLFSLMVTWSPTERHLAPGTAAVWHLTMRPARPHYSLFFHGVTSHNLVWWHVRSWWRGGSVAQGHVRDECEQPLSTWWVEWGKERGWRADPLCLREEEFFLVENKIWERDCWTPATPSSLYHWLWEKGVTFSQPARDVLCS